MIRNIAMQSKLAVFEKENILLLYKVFYFMESWTTQTYVPCYFKGKGKLQNYKEDKTLHPKNSEPRFQFPIFAYKALPHQIRKNVLQWLFA